MMIANGKIVIGNDGGVYSRPLTDTQQYGDWSDLNATLATWQYYDARAGELAGATGSASGAGSRTTAPRSDRPRQRRWWSRPAATAST